MKVNIIEDKMTKLGTIGETISLLSKRRHAECHSDIVHFAFSDAAITTFTPEFTVCTAAFKVTI